MAVPDVDRRSIRPPLGVAIEFHYEVDVEGGAETLIEVHRQAALLRARTAEQAGETAVMQAINTAYDNLKVRGVLTGGER